MNATANAPFNADTARFNMIEQQIRPWNVLNMAILDLLDAVPRHAFVPEGQQALAYADTQLPLPCGQNMLEPKIEARLLQDLAVQAHETVLEIGTGSGYMAALLGRQAAQVVSLEIHPELVALAQRNLQSAQIDNVQVICADGASYRAAQGPFDVIVLSGSVAEVPEFLLEQLKPTGRLMGIVGQAPMMRAHLVQTTPAGRTVSQPWDAVAPRLLGFAEPSRFVF